MSQAGEKPSEDVTFEAPASPKKEIVNGAAAPDLQPKAAPSGPVVVPVRVFRDETVG